MNELAQLKREMEEMKRWKASLELSSSIPLSLDQAFRARFSIPIITKVPLNFGSIGAESATTLTVQVPGASIGDLVVVTPPTDSVAGIGHFQGYVSAGGVVTIKFNNPYSASASDPGSGTFTIGVFKK